MNVAVVLQKPMSLAKTRLSDLLSPKERIELVCAMLSDVLYTLSKATAIDHYVVLTSDYHAIRLAKQFGASVFDEGEANGINQAVGQFVKTLDPKTRLYIFPSDIPLIASDDIHHLAKHNENVPVVIVPCKNGTGTNGLVLHPPTIIQPQFGVNSKKKHIEQACLNGIPYALHDSSLFQLDIDTPDDLWMLKDANHDTYTMQYLESNHIFEKIAFHEV